MTAPPGPGMSPPPLIHVGWIRSASSTVVTPPSPMPAPVVGPGYGERPTMLVVSRTPASSTNATAATTYGGSRSKPGNHRWLFTVKPTTVARPDTSVGDQDRLRHDGQIGTGGCTSVPQSSQPCTCRRPSAPDVQNQRLAGVSSGRGLIPLLRETEPGRVATFDCDVGLRYQER